MQKNSLPRSAGRFLACSGLALLLIAVSGNVLPARAQSRAITADPAQDKSAPAAMETFQLPSHGSLLNALVYVAAGNGPHPVVILLHGFPGNEKNLDIAQTLRRAGYDVLYFDYRGSWGSPGDFSFTHCIEDTQAAIAYVRNPANARKLRADPNFILLAGHSMGGFMARYVAAQDPEIKATILISAAGMADRLGSYTPEQRRKGIPAIAKSLEAEGMAPLAGCTPTSLAEETVAHADAWQSVALAPKFAGRPLLVITSDDGLAPSNDAFRAAIPAAGSKVTAVHFATDHSYSDHRIALQQAILDFLAKLK
ncbi:MAG TPA: alpha/beta fold hydrolase [Acidobacteriaceae bacterium]|jgi:pimeloyl-ACP methyl ester carboxylesterase